MAMDNEQITICNRGHGRLTVEFGKVPHARLQWYAPGLEIYTRGAFPVKLYPIAANVAMNECITRNIPVVSMRRIVPDAHRSLDKKPQNQPELPGLFAGTDNTEGST